MPCEPEPEYVSYWTQKAPCIKLEGALYTALNEKGIKSKIDIIVSCGYSPENLQRNKIGLQYRIHTEGGTAEVKVWIYSLSSIDLDKPKNITEQVLKEYLNPIS